MAKSHLTKEIAAMMIRDVWKVCQIGLAPAARPILAKFPNITRTVNPKLYSQSHDYLYLYWFL